MKLLQLLKEIKITSGNLTVPINPYEVWEFISSPHILGPQGDFDLEKNYLGYNIANIDSNKDVHMLKIYFKDNLGSIFYVTYIWNWEKPNEYEFFNIGEKSHFRRPEGLLKEIKVVRGEAYPLNLEAVWKFISKAKLKGNMGPFDIDKNYIGFEKLPWSVAGYHSNPSKDIDLIITYFRDNMGNPFKVLHTYNHKWPNLSKWDFYHWYNVDEDKIPDNLLKEIKVVRGDAYPLNIEAVWDFISQDVLKGNIGQFDINKHYIGFEKIPFRGHPTPGKDVHLISTYFRDNKGYPFKVIYSYNYGREEGYDFYNWFNIDEDDIPNNLLREIKVTSGQSELPFPLDSEYMGELVDESGFFEDPSQLEYLGHIAHPPYRGHPYEGEDNIVYYDLYFKLLPNKFYSKKEGEEDAILVATVKYNKFWEWTNAQAYELVYPSGIQRTLDNLKW
jgi:hypothetical protein